jgi:hypothetical protein
MALVESQSPACPDVGARSRQSPPRLGHLGDTGRNDGADRTAFSVPAWLRPFFWLLHQIGQRRWCAQCAHAGLRIGPHWCRTGPDSVCFGGRLVFASAGTRFESHLGHVFSLFRGLRASESAQTVHLWATAGPIFVGVALLWPTAPSRGSGSGGAVYSFMARGAASCMTRRWLGERCCLCWFAFLDVMTVHGDVAR